MGESVSDVMTSSFDFLCWSVCSAVVCVCFSSGTLKASRAGEECFLSPSSTSSQTDVTSCFPPSREDTFRTETQSGRWRPKCDFNTEPAETENQHLFRFLLSDFKLGVCSDLKVSRRVGMNVETRTVSMKAGPLQLRVHSLSSSPSCFTRQLHSELVPSLVWKKLTGLHGVSVGAH